MRTGVILATYNSSEWTAECLRTLYKYTPTNLFDLVVFNNGSTDDTSSVISKYPCFSLSSIVNQGGIPPYIAATNYMLKRNCYDYICFIQNDMLFTPGWLTDSISLFKIYGDKTVIGLSNIVGRDCILLSDAEREKISSAAKEKIYSFANTYPIICPVSYFTDVGFPSMDYNHGECDDVDLNMRMSEKGYLHITTNNVNVFHGLGVSRLSVEGHKAQRSSSVNLFVSRHGKEAFDKFNYFRKSEFFCDGIPYTRHGV
jgi:GT2 family glycosyltransferase